MDINKLHESLNSEIQRDLKRNELIRYLKECIETTPNTAREKKAIAYYIASLMSTDYVRELDSADSIDKTLVIAGELEAENSEIEKLWIELVDSIKKL